MAKKRTKKNKKLRKEKKEITKRIIVCSILVIIILCLSIFIFNTDYLKPSINEETTNYISFNNRNTTDMLKIRNIIKLSDKHGKSKINTKSLNLDITGKKGTDYEIIIYPLMNEISKKYIHFLITEEKEELISSDLEMMPNSSDGGKIVYQGKIDNKSKVLRMWVSNEYPKKVESNLFEVRIKPR